MTLEKLGGGGVIVEGEGPLGQAAIWAAVASLNTARESFAAGAVDGKLYAVGGTGTSNNTLSSVERYQFPVFVDVHTATGDTLVDVIDPNATLRNRTTGAERTGDPLIARSGETIAALIQTQARVFRTEET